MAKSETIEDVVGDWRVESREKFLKREAEARKYNSVERRLMWDLTQAIFDIMDESRIAAGGLSYNTDWTVVDGWLYASMIGSEYNKVVERDEVSGSLIYHRDPNKPILLRYRFEDFLRDFIPYDNVNNWVDDILPLVHNPHYLSMDTPDRIIALTKIIRNAFDSFEERCALTIKKV